MSHEKERNNNTVSIILNILNNERVQEHLVPACAQYWNSLDEPCFARDGVAAFKSLDQFCPSI